MNDICQKRLIHQNIVTMHDKEVTSEGRWFRKQNHYEWLFLAFFLWRNPRMQSQSEQRYQYAKRSNRTSI